jgi:adenosine deaminase
MNRALLARLPKVELHNHLDGGLRVSTVVELADAIGYADLPSSDPDTLSDWFYQGESGSLEAYLEAFTHTLAVMQSEEAIERIAYEAGLDLAADGIVYAEVRFAPVLNTAGGLAREAVVEAALAGFGRATDETGVQLGLVIDAMRDRTDSLADARVAVRYADRGVVGFDLAGPEAGFPPDVHLPACRLVKEYGLGLTIHAGEGDGLESIHRALARCGADRIGHGVRIVDDVVVENGKIAACGRLASRVRDFRIPMEVCPTSNVHTLGLTREKHPFGSLYAAGFNVTLNTDNRLMSRVSLTDEFANAVAYDGLGMKDLKTVTLAALDSAFVDHGTRLALRAAIEPAYES